MSDLGNLPRDFEEWFAKEHGGMTAHSFAKIFSIREPKKLLSLWELKQKEVDSLKAQLNNMEACYIEKKRECEGRQKRIDEVLQEVKGLERFTGEDCIADFDVLQGAVSHACKRLEKTLRGDHE